MCNNVVVTAIEMAHEHDGGRRERKKSATRKALQDAALSLACERGVDHVTVEEISEAADVSPRTFFNYFSSKEEALTGDPPDLDERLVAALAESPDVGVVSALRTALCRLAAESSGRRDELMARKKLVGKCPALLPRHIAAFAALERALAETIAAHLGTDIETDLYPSLLAAAGASALRVAYQRWEGSADHPFETLVREAFEILERGLRASVHRPEAGSSATSTSARRPTRRPIDKVAR